MSATVRVLTTFCPSGVLYVSSYAFPTFAIAVSFQLTFTVSPKLRKSGVLDGDRFSHTNCKWPPSAGCFGDVRNDFLNSNSSHVLQPKLGLETLKY